MTRNAHWLLPCRVQHSRPNDDPLDGSIAKYNLAHATSMFCGLLGPLGGAFAAMSAMTFPLAVYSRRKEADEVRRTGYRGTLSPSPFMGILFMRRLF